MNINEETIEEAAERFYFEQSKSYEDTIEPIFDNSRYLVAGFIEGAKWQQERTISKECYEDSLNMQMASNAGYESKIKELKDKIKTMYSEEDLKNAFRDGVGSVDCNQDVGMFCILTEDKWFEQFKKK